jgi:hypothetical protein
VYSLDLILLFTRDCFAALSVKIDELTASRWLHGPQASSTLVVTATGTGRYRPRRFVRSASYYDRERDSGVRNGKDLSSISEEEEKLLLSTAADSTSSRAADEHRRRLLSAANINGSVPTTDVPTNIRRRPFIEEPENDILED